MKKIKKLKYGNDNVYKFGDIFLTTDDRYYRENIQGYPSHQLFPSTYKDYEFLLTDSFRYVSSVYDFSNPKSSNIFEIYENNDTLEININDLQRDKIYLLDSGSNGVVYIFYIAAKKNSSDINISEVTQQSSNYPGKILLSLGKSSATNNPLFPIKTNIYFENFSKDQRLTHACPIHFFNCKLHLTYNIDQNITLNDYTSYYSEDLTNIVFFQNTMNWDNLPTSERSLTYILGEGDQLITSTNPGIANGSYFTEIQIGTQASSNWRYIYIDNIPTSIVESSFPSAALELEETLLYTFKMENTSIQEIISNYTNIFNFMKYHYVGWSAIKNDVISAVTNSNLIYTPPINTNAVYTNISGYSTPVFYNSSTNQWEAVNNEIIYFTQSEIDEIFNPTS